MIGDFEIAGCSMLGGSAPKQLIVLQEVKMEKKLIGKIAAIQMGELKMLTGKAMQDPAELIKKFAFIVLAFVSLAAVRAVVLDLNVNTI